MLLEFEDGEDVPLLGLDLRDASANCSSASCEGSFKVKNPKIEAVFFFLAEAADSLDEVALEDMEARLGDDKLAVSYEDRERSETVGLPGVA